MSKERLFSFNTPEHSDYHLEVVSFVGSEMIGELYGYEIELISTKEDIDFDAMLHADVSLQLHNKESDDIYIHGILASFEAHQKIGEYIYYKAYLVPKLWRLSIAQHQEIFLNQSITDIMESILRDAQFTSSDYELRLQGEYEPREYVCMYKESRYDFLRRWMEREGLYFYFEQTQQQCKLIITDAKSIHQSLPDMDKIPYKPASGLQQFSDHAVSSLIYRSNTTINSVKMKNYDYNKPSLDISATSQDSNQAYSETYLFGNNLSSIAEAQKLSSINEEKYKALSSEMSGESNIPALTPGYIYRLQEYFKESLNGDYLMLRVESSGSQRGFLSTGFTQDGDDSSYYSNTFMMIPSQRQYRMQSQTPWPHIGGMISATIDAQGSGETAELDKYGRYKVIMPFDISGRKDAKASAYLRMAQPSAGAKQGFHFPLHKGTEVLIAFKGGDPDQPIITAAVPNVETPSPVNEDNVTKNVIQTHGGNIIHMEDTPGEAHIKLAVHDDLSSIVIHNEPDEPEKGWNKENYEAGEGGIAYYSKGPFKFLSGSWDNTVGGLKEDFMLGASLGVMVGLKTEFQLAGGIEIASKGMKIITPESTKLHGVEKIVTATRDFVVNDGNRVTLGQTIDTHNQRVQTIEDNVQVVGNRVTTVENAITTGEDENRVIGNKITTIGTNIETIEDNIETHQTKINTSINVINSIRTQVTNGEAFISDVTLDQETSEVYTY